MKPLTLGYSPCPNDTFIFTAWIEGMLVDAPLVEVRYEDIDVLNGLALDGSLDIIKVSFHVFGHLRENYCLLRSGGALGRGCGPLVVAREPLSPDALKGKKIAIPGAKTTAALLLRLFDPSLEDLRIMPFDEIMPATRDGEVDAGLIIHEGRFTHRKYGLSRVIDLGEWWESETGKALPLGGIVARRSLGASRLREIGETIRGSLDFAYGHKARVWPTVRRHAQEMDDAVMQRHIDLYVNEFTVDYGEEGEAAIRRLLDTAERLEIIPRSDRSVFAE